jgi:hypothetical protein
VYLLSDISCRSTPGDLEETEIEGGFENQVFSLRRVSAAPKSPDVRYLDRGPRPLTEGQANREETNARVHDHTPACCASCLVRSEEHAVEASSIGCEDSGAHAWNRFPNAHTYLPVGVDVR